MGFVIHARHIDHFPGIEHPLRIKNCFYMAKGLGEFRTKKALRKLAPRQAFAVFSAGRPSVLHDQRQRFFGNFPQLAQSRLRFQVDQGAHMDTARAGMRVHRHALHTYLFRKIVNPANVISQMFDGDRGVLDEGDGFGISANTHEDAQSNGTYKPNVGLLARIADHDDWILML